MATIKVKNIKGEDVNTIDIKDSVFVQPVREHLFKDVIVAMQANARQGTHSTKTRTEVSGGGKKPWKQKGTGQARAGTSRSPLWPGGGVTFGPKPRDYDKKVNKKAKKAALISALSKYYAEDRIIVVDKIGFAEPKTKSGVAMLGGFNIDNALILYIREEGENILKSFRNIPKIDVRDMGIFNLFDVLKHHSLLVTEKALRKLEEVAS